MTLQVDAIRKTYGDVVAVDEVTLSLETGSFHCLLGPNGSGKTTLFRLVLGLTRADSGSIQRPADPLGCGFQQPNFYPDLTVRENLDVFSRLSSADSEWRAELVEELGLRRALDRPGGDLSGGFARKLDLALALLNEPRYLLLDEPLGALDDVSKAQLLDFLDRYTDDGNTVLVSTHHVDDFEPYLDRVTIMHQGTVVFDREQAEIELDEFESLQNYYVDMVLEREGLPTEQ